MRKSFIEDFFEKMNDKIFFLLVLLCQLLFIFQGLDFTDSGFDAVFYRRIFEDPQTVQYNFSYWFTGILGGLWLKLFPGLGLLGLRIAGVLVTTLILAITYDLLKKYLHSVPLKMGLVLIVFFLGTSVRELNYEDISALFFMSACWFLFTGLNTEKSFRIFIAGLFIAANVFASLPNILGLCFIFCIWFAGSLNGWSVKKITIQSVFFLLGFIVMSVCMLLLMRALHHDAIYGRFLKQLRQVGAGYGNARGIYVMLKTYFVHYGMAISTSIVVLVVLWSSAAAWRNMKIAYPKVKPASEFLKYFILFILTAIILYRAAKDADFWFYLFLFYAGTSLITGFLIITGRQQKDMKLLALMGCTLLLIMPFGNNFVLISVGKYAVWIMVPVTVDYLLTIRALSSTVVVSENSRHAYEQTIGVGQMTALRNASIYLTVVYIIAVTYFYPYFDRSNRLQMKYTVHSEQAAAIYTSAGRARVINELLEQSKHYVKPNDYVLAYDCMPMYYYLANAKPFMHNAWLWLYDDTTFKEELYKSLKEINGCPVVIMQKRSTIGNNWPDNPGEDYTFRPRAPACMAEFLKKYSYSQVWENDFFRILKPAALSYEPIGTK